MKVKDLILIGSRVTRHNHAPSALGAQLCVLALSAQCSVTDRDQSDNTDTDIFITHAYLYTHTARACQRYTQNRQKKERNTQRVRKKERNWTRRVLHMAGIIYSIATLLFGISAGISTLQRIYPPNEGKQVTVTQS